jgi:membrane protease YdiL (CAAX protease family)
VAAAGATVVLDVVAAWTGITLGFIGPVAVSPALPLALVLAARLGIGRLGASRRSLLAWRELAVGFGIGLTLATLAYALILARPAEVTGLLVAALAEELVFRVAALLALGAVLARLLGRAWRNPRDWGPAPGFAALGATALLFSVLPGHVAQMTNPVTTLSFASLSLLLGYTVLRTGAVWPAVLAHALLNLTTIAAWRAASPAGVRLAIAASALGALVVAAQVAGRRLGVRPRVPTVIDLRAAEAGAGLRRE